MGYQSIASAIVLWSLGGLQLAVADDQATRPAGGAEGLEITMRIIEDPDAIAAEVITRRLELPAPPGGRDKEPPAGPAEGAGLGGAAEQQGAGQKGKEFGAEVSERARDLARQAGEQREEFGRSKAEEMRPDPPRPPAPPPRP